MACKLWGCAAMMASRQSTEDGKPMYDALSTCGQGSSKPDKPKLDVATFIDWREDLYDVTVVACFGGLRFQLSGGAYLILHPIFPCLGCIVLFVVQLILIAGVALECHDHQYLQHNEEDRQALGDKFDMSLLTDFTLMAVVQIVIFAELQQGMKMFCFSVRPWTWKHLPELDPCEPVLGARAFPYRWTLAPIAVLVSVLKISISYLVSVTSLSVILSCNGVTDAIFNSLALCFILELDESVWQLLHTASDLKVRSPLTTHDMNVCSSQSKNRKFKFKLQRGDDEQKSQFHLPEKNWRRIAVGISITLVFIDQMTLTLQGLATGWLPTTRLICGVWGLATDLHQTESRLEDEQGWGAKQLHSTLDFCISHEYVRWNTWTPERYTHAFNHHPRIWIGSVLVCLTFLTLPPVVEKLAEKKVKLERGREHATAMSDDESDASSTD